MNKKRVYIAGHNGMVGSAICRALKNSPNNELITIDRRNLDLTNQFQVHKFFEQQSIDEVYIAAAKVGGIQANNTLPAEFIYENLMMECNIVHSAHVTGVKKLLLLGSSCIYPRLAIQPIQENSLLSGYLEPTNEPYAIAKISGIKLCESYRRQYGRDYRSAMPANLYGPGDNFHPEYSHVLPALMSRFYEAKLRDKPEVSVWGTGTARREFLHVDDLASASLFIMSLSAQSYIEHTLPLQTHINIGTGHDCTIRELAETVSQIVGFKGSIAWDPSRPDGAPRKVLDVTLINKMGWRSSIDLETGIADLYDWYLANYKIARR